MSHDRDMQAERAAFEEWYTQNAFDYERNPIGSRECALQWKSWLARCARSGSFVVSRDPWHSLLAYVLQDDLHNRLTPRVIDIAYSAFMAAKRPNPEDGGASDWFTDTRPMVKQAIEKLRKDLFDELAAASPSEGKHG